jgi:hypothetical protein
MSLWGSFTGSDAKRALTDAYANSNRALAQGESKAAGATTAGYGEARGYFQPYADAGTRTNALMGDYLGTNGADAQKAAYASYAGSDPFRQSNADFANLQLGRMQNAQGWGGGAGPAQLAVARANLERGSQDFNNYWNRLSGYGQQGFGAAQGMAGLASGEGNNLAGIYGGFAQQRAGNAINYGNAMAQNANTLWNNALGLGGVALKAAGVGGFGPSVNGGGGGGGGWQTTTTPTSVAGGVNYLSNLFK